MIRLKTVACPYCNFENNVQVDVLEAGRHTPQIVVCDSDAGGCDRYFVAQAQTTISISVTAFRVDGLNPENHDDQPST